MKNDNEILLMCECSSCEHQMVIRWDESDSEVYVNVHLVTWKGFWRRLLDGIRYVFGHRSVYGEFDEIILRKEDAEGLQRVVDHLKQK